MATTKTIDFRALNSELEKILDDLQSGTLDIDEALKKYQRGLAITEALGAYLKTAENKITKTATG